MSAPLNEHLAGLETIDASLLPPLVREWVGLMGWPAVIALVRVYGGTRIYVPKTVGDNHPLACLIGLTAAQALAAHCGGEEHVDVPRVTRALVALRDRAMAAAREQASVAALARQYGMTERGIYKALGRAVDPIHANQDSLF